MVVTLLPRASNEVILVPLAVPLIAGPSAAATVLLLMAREPERWLHWVAALGLAWVATGSILLTSTWIGNLAGQRALIACERLMGLLLTTIAVQMALTGIREFLTDLP